MRDTITPTLIIGLGGSGIEVLMRLRKRLYDMHGPDSQPYLRYLMLDTDKNRYWPNGAPQEEYATVMPQSGEWINCQITAHQFRHVFEHPDRQGDSPFVGWLNPQLRYLRDIAQGAGTHRQLGRMAFMLKYEEIHRRITEHLRVVLAGVAHSAREQSQGRNVRADALEVVIVTSLMGGTGSGMLIDVAYLVKDILQQDHVLRQLIRHSTSLFCFMPSLYETLGGRGLSQGLMRNAYGTLLELDYYGQTQKPSCFMAPWDGREHPIEGSGWDRCYLIDRDNGLRSLDLPEALQMTADYLFLRYLTPVGNQLLSIECNLFQFAAQRFMLPLVHHGSCQPVDGQREEQAMCSSAASYSCNFGSLGVADINIDVRRVHRTASCRLALHLIVEHWLGPAERYGSSQYNEWLQRALAPETLTVPRAFLVSLRFDDLIRDLYQEPDRGTNWLELMEQGFWRLRIEQCERSSHSLRSFLTEHHRLLEEHGACADGTRGRAAICLTHRFTEVATSLAGRLKSVLRSHCDEHGILASRHLLDQMQHYLHHLRNKGREFGVRIGQTAGTEALARLEEAERLPAYARRIAVPIEFERAIASIRLEVENQYRAAAAPFVERVIAETLKSLEGGEKDRQLSERDLRQLLDDVQRDLSSSAQKLQSWFDHLRSERRADHTRSQTQMPMWDPGKYDEEVRRVLAHPEPNICVGREADWTRLAEVILKRLSDDVGLNHLSQLLERFGAEKFGSLVADACGQLIPAEAMTLDEMAGGSVVDLLFEHGRVLSREKCAMLQTMIDSSRPYLPLKLQPQPENPRPQAYGVFVYGPGRPENREALVETFNQLARDSRESVYYLEAGPRSEMFLVWVSWAFPLFCYRGIDRLHEAYHAAGSQFEEYHIGFSEPCLGGSLLPYWEASCPRRRDPSGLRAEEKLEIGPHLLIISTDSIAELDVDAIACSRSRSLRSGMASRHSVHGSIQQAGGLEIDQQAAGAGPIPHGEIFVSTASTLACDYVIHAGVIDDLTGQTVTGETIALVIQRIFEECVARKWESVAVPLMGTRVGDLPQHRCAEVLFEEVCRRLEARPEYPKVVVFSLTGGRALVRMVRLFTETQLRKQYESERIETSTAKVETSLGSPTLQYVLRYEFPYPIARLYVRLLETREPFRQLPVLLALFESTLQFVAIVLICDYLGSPRRNKEIDGYLKQTFLRSGITGGKWVEIIREMGKSLADDPASVAAGFVQLAGDERLLNRLGHAVRLRNGIAHNPSGATQQEVRQFKELLISMLGELTVLRDWKLLNVKSVTTSSGLQEFVASLAQGERDSFMEVSGRADHPPESHRLMLVNLEQGTAVYLSPWICISRCPTCQDEHLFHLDKLSGNAAVLYCPFTEFRFDGDQRIAVAHELRDKELPARLEALCDRHLCKTRFHESFRYFSLPEVVREPRRRLRPGDRLTGADDVEIEAFLVAGGMADIYRARRRSDGAAVAIKLLPAQFLAEPSMIRRFEHEQITAMELPPHPHIVKTYDFGSQAGDYYIVMEFASGWPVGEQRALDLRAVQTPMDPVPLLRAAVQLGDALQHIHNEGIIHRDLKPGNVLLFEPDIVKIADFGVSRGKASPHVTVTGMIVGTPAYMSPEHMGMAEDLKPVSDLYSLGVILYELATGELPFWYDSPMDIMLAHRDPRRRPERPSVRRPSLPKALDRLVLRLLEKAPSRRFPNALEFTRSAKQTLDELL